LIVAKLLYGCSNRRLQEILGKKIEKGRTNNTETEIYIPIHALSAEKFKENGKRAKAP